MAIVSVAILLAWSTTKVKIIRSPLQEGLSLISQPFSKVRQKILEYSEVVKALDSILADQAKLIDENTDLRSQLTKMREIEHQNQLLKEQLSLSPSVDRPATAASVVGFDPTGFFQSIIINKGRRHGLVKGLPVTVKGFLIGVTDRIDEPIATAWLLNHHQIRLPVRLQDSRALGLLRGGLPGITVEDIPIDTEIKVGEPITTAGYGERIPAGLPVGYVDKILSSHSDIYQSVLIKTPIQFRLLETVFINQ